MNLLKNKTGSPQGAPQTAYVPTIDVNWTRHEIAQIRHAIDGWQQEHDALAQQASLDWAHDTVNRARRKELREFIAEGKARIAELEGQVASTDGDQASERKRLEPLIETVFEKKAMRALQTQEEDDELRLLIDAYNAAGGGGRYNAQFEGAKAGNVLFGSATGRVDETFSYERGKRLVKV
jgi:DNA-binding transcriptional MerR regulator